MLKGVNKLIVEINNPESEYFERAIFFVRPQKADICASALSANADKIMAKAESKGTSSKKTFKKVCLSVLKYALSAVVGGAISYGVLMLL